MKKTLVVCAAAMIGSAAGCGDDGGGGGRVLWLVPDGDELHVKLVEQAPTSTY